MVFNLTHTCRFYWRIEDFSVNYRISTCWISETVFKSSEALEYHANINENINALLQDMEVKD